MLAGKGFESKEYRLNNGATIAVIGAGPAGSFFSILALKKAYESGIRLNIVMFDGKNFLREGPSGCNMCAGVISRDLLEELDRLGLPIPRERVQRLIDSYIFHTIAGSHTIHSPPDRGSLPVVFRGNGPRFSWQSRSVSFDDYLLDHAIRSGAEIIPSFVKGIDFQKGANAHPVVQWRGGTLPADLVVVATGVSTKFVKNLGRCGISYQPPRCVQAFQAELDLGQDNLEKYLGSSIHVFSLGLKGIRFAAIIPKNRFATVSLVGHRDLDKRHLVAFLASPIVKRLFPHDWHLPERFCFCRPSLPVSGGKEFYGDRLMIIGDAAISRHYKNGIDSAFRTARYAVDAIFKKDLSSGALKKSYSAPVLNRFRTENFCARILFKLNDVVSPRRFWVDTHLHYVKYKPKSHTARTIFYLTWNLFTGQTSYRDIFLKSLNPRFLFWMGLGILRRLKRTN